MFNDNRAAKKNRNFLSKTVFWLVLIGTSFWLLTRSKPLIKKVYFTTQTASNEFEICSELVLFTYHISCMWTSTHDYVLRKWSSPCQHRYGLEFKVKHKSLHLLLCILLAGDIATKPGPVQNTALCCLSFNARSLKSVNKHEDGSTTSN